MRRGWLVLVLVCGCAQIQPAAPDRDLGPPDQAVPLDLAAVDFVSCPPGCATEGSTQCTTDGKVKTCTRIGGCLVFNDPIDCASGQLCCAGACIASDEQNCGACGTSCGGASPTCSMTLKR